MKRMLWITALSGALLSGGASAAVLSGSFSNAEETTEINQTGLLPLFDTGLGTLNSVTLTINGSATTDLSVANNAQQAQRTRVTSVVDLSFSSSLAGLDLSSILFSLQMSTGLVSLDAGQTLLFPDVTASDSTILNPAAGLFGAAGGGTFSISCESLSALSISGGGGNIAATQQTTAGCGAAISYDYTPRTTQVPEPGSLALLGVAALGAAGIARRRKAA